MTCPDLRTLSRFAAGEPVEDAAALRAHVEGCAHCRDAVARAAGIGETHISSRAATSLPRGADDAPQIPRGTLVGRYLVLERLGAGAMGVVYTAYDPDLDRRIALKVLRPDPAGGSEGQEWILREAQVMARLAHPNAVSVHDVGTFGSQVFLAMDYIEGSTLREWLAEKRPTHDVLNKLVQAGRGLAAAHAAGLVHRDVKPDNVLVGQDGIVRVTDFGLASLRYVDRGRDQTLPHVASLRTSQRRITREESFVGTPAYMSPEQLQGKLADAASDQFAFCVTAWEALFGERPFGGSTLAELVAEVTRGDVRPPPKHARVPSWVRAALLRGLSADPRARHPSLDALLVALEHKRPRARLRRVLPAAGAALALAGLAAVAASVQHRNAQLCTGAERRLEGAWDPELKRAMRAAFARSGSPVAQTAAAQVEAVLDRYAGAWVAMHTDACAATRRRGEQTESMLELRMTCLEQRLKELRALTTVLADADASVVNTASGAARALSGIQACADAAGLASRAPPPGDPEARGKVERAQGLIARAKALQDAGKFVLALSAADEAVAAAREAAWRPALGEALLLQATLLDRNGRAAAAEAPLHEALWAAQAGRDDELAARVWIKLVGIVGYRLQRPKEVPFLVGHAQATLERIGGSPLLEARLRSIEGLIHSVAGRVVEAEERHRRAVAIAEKALHPDSPDLAGFLNNFGLLLSESGRYAEAEPLYARALGAWERTLGADHPDLAITLNNLASVQRLRGDYPAAIATVNRVLGIFERTVAPDHPAVAEPILNLAAIEQRRGQLTEAAAHARRALAAIEKHRGVDNYGVCYSLDQLAAVALLQGHDADADALLQRSMRVREAELGSDHRELVDTLALRCRTLVRLRRSAEARGSCDRALALARSYPRRHPALVVAHEALGTLGLATGDLAAARAHLEEAQRTRIELLGESHPDVPVGLVRLAQLDAREGRMDEAAMGYRKAMDLADRLLGPAAPAGCSARLGLAVVHAQRRSPALAAQLVSEAATRCPAFLDGPREPAAARPAFAALGAEGSDPATAVDAWLAAQR